MTVEKRLAELEKEMEGWRGKNQFLFDEAKEEYKRLLSENKNGKDKATSIERRESPVRDFKKKRFSQLKRK